MAHRLLLLGIDEAGYGPRLGSLCVASSLFSIKYSKSSQADTKPQIPSLWHLLGSAVRTATDRDKQRIAIDDSKKLLKRVSGKADTAALELGVRSFLHLAQKECSSWSQILESLLCKQSSVPWSNASQPELHQTSSRIAIMTNPLKRAALSADVRCLGIRCLTLDAQAFNHGCQSLGSKSAVSFQLVAQLMDRALNVRQPLWITIDRQGGRTAYASVLREHFPYLGINELHRSPHHSLYKLRQHDGPDCWVEFRINAEKHSLPVALASMCAKLVRELHMHQFNAYWCKQVPELKPTAGYGIDAKRWIRDIQESSLSASLDSLVRVR